MTAAPGLSSSIVGPYRGTWDGLDLGLTSDGFRIFHTNTGREITSDMFGDGTVLDRIYTGTTVTLSFTLIHWNAQAVEPMMWWMGNSAVYDWGKVDKIGVKQFDRARPLVLTSCFGPTAGVIQNSMNPTADPVTITFPKTLMRPNAQIESLLSGTQPRLLDIVLDVYPINGAVSLNDVNDSDALRPSECGNLRYFFATRNPEPA